jgi:hypothetical protein
MLILGFCGIPARVTGDLQELFSFTVEWTYDFSAEGLTTVYHAYWCGARLTASSQLHHLRYGA